MCGFEVCLCVLNFNSEKRVTELTREICQIIICFMKMDSSRNYIIHINIILKREKFPVFLSLTRYLIIMSNLYKNTVKPQLMATSLQRPPLYMQCLLSSVPKVAVVERFNHTQLSNYLYGALHYYIAILCYWGLNILPSVLTYLHFFALQSKLLLRKKWARCQGFMNLKANLKAV